MTPASSPWLKTEPLLDCSVWLRLNFYAGIFYWVTQCLCSSSTENGTKFPIFWGLSHDHTITLVTRLKISAPFSWDVLPSPHHFTLNQIFCFMWKALEKMPTTIWGRTKIIPSHLYFLFTFIMENCLWLFLVALFSPERVHCGGTRLWGLHLLNQKSNWDPN